MLSHRRRWIGPIASATVAIALFVILLPRADHRDRASPPANHVDATAAEAVTAAEARPKLDAHRNPAITQGAASPAASAPAAEPALPPDGTPLIEFALDLDRRARAGDARAACRLGAELNRCGMVRHLITGPRSDAITAQFAARQSLSAEQRERLIRDHLAQEEAAAHVQAICRGSDELKLLLPARYFLVAALQGHSNSTNRFLSLPSARDLLSDPELYQLYRTHALSLFRRQLERGDAEIVSRWSMALDWYAGALGGVLTEDLRQAHVARALQFRIEQDTSREPRTRRPENRTAAQWAADLEGAEAIYQRHFAHSPLYDAQRERQRREALDPIPAQVRSMQLDSFQCDEL